MVVFVPINFCLLPAESGEYALQFIVFLSIHMSRVLNILVFFMFFFEQITLCHQPLKFFLKNVMLLKLLHL